MENNRKNDILIEKKIKALGSMVKNARCRILLSEWKDLGIF